MKFITDIYNVSLVCNEFFNVSLLCNRVVLDLNCNNFQIFSKKCQKHKTEVMMYIWYSFITEETNIIKFITDKTNIIDPCSKFYNLLCNA